MKNTLNDLNNALFEQLERLQDDEGMKDDAAFEREMRRSDAVAGIAAQIIKTGNLALRACQYAEENGKDANKKLLGLIGE